MGEPAKKEAVYDDLHEIPENLIGEIIAGELIVAPRLSPRHSHAVSVLDTHIGPPYRFGEGGPGDWITLFEPEIALGEHLLVPDLAGWKRERLKQPPDTNFIATTPDWICEVLSPATFRTDRIKKMPLYAQFAVPFLWLLDPLARTLEVFRLESGRWSLVSTHADDDRVRAEPFQDLEIPLARFWWE
jgi:Uma2 family endonuclease